jgi:5-(carboxyamino)imidazole ribonucleotide synthase
MVGIRNRGRIAAMGPLGILGGGQLGRMTLQSASRLGIDVVIAERTSRSPAARLTDTSVVFQAGWGDEEALRDLARLAPIVTLENEFVDAMVLERLQALGCSVRPAPGCVGVVQDKLRQKQALAAAELPVPNFRPVSAPEDLGRLGKELGWPLMLKARRDGYDGRGNTLVRSPRDADAACERLGWPDRTLLAEAWVNFERELAVLVVRALDGSVVSYPVVETRQDPELHVCREVLAPAAVEPAVAERATYVARAAIDAVGGVGAFGVELFLLRGGQVCVNELAPRPHNSAHYTIEACWTSQFENHVRAVLELGLGDTSLRAPAAAMVNLLGSGAGVVAHDDLGAALRVPGACVHLYGKGENRLGRKLGHVTAVGSSVDEALQRARAAAACLHL